MIRLREISLPPEHTAAQLSYEAARMLKIPTSRIRQVKLIRRSIDARKKPDVRVVYTVDVAVDGNEGKILRNSKCRRAAVVSYHSYKPPIPVSKGKHPPVVVGFGPAGMFAALILSMAGLNPIVLERGEDAAARREKVEAFFKTGQLDVKSNVQFGEGGAGTFSDGKLNTGVNNPRIDWILEQMVAAGAGEDILYDAKPHVGTDVLVDMVQNIRRRIIGLGGQVRFCSQVTALRHREGVLTGVQLADGEVIDCEQVIFAVGHIARDTFSMLADMKIPMERKPFSMGVRIEHKQASIDRAQYGSDKLPLPPADYKLVKHLDDATVYTFCMCPGGYVVAAASEEGGVVTNGMSYASRDGENANAALLVTVNPEEFPGQDPLAGVRWQEQIEKKAYAVGGGGYFAPAQRVEDFLAHRPSSGAGSVVPTYRPGVTWCDLHTVLPEKITDCIARALPLLDGNLKGFSHGDSVLTAPESRSSCPLRILRGADRQSVFLKGFYPAGEGAGYAGGIMSAAIDGIMSAEALIEGI